MQKSPDKGLFFARWYFYATGVFDMWVYCVVGEERYRLSIVNLLYVELTHPVLYEKAIQGKSYKILPPFLKK
jgi:elongation factor P hydroxylase